MALQLLYPVVNPLHRINHPFNEPRNYGRHEGLDLEAKRGDIVVAAASGVVTRIYNWTSGTSGANAYGRYIKVRHADGYETMYCHMDAFYSGLVVNQSIAMGSPVGYAGSSGNSTAPHVHWQLMHPTLGLDGYVYDKVLNPAPYLVHAMPRVGYASMLEGYGLRGIHGPADPGSWAWVEHSAISVIGQTHCQAVKVLCPGTTPEQVVALRNQGAVLVYARLFAKMGEPRGLTMAQRAQWFVNEVRSEALQLYNAGVVYFELHNEPNLTDEGLLVNWINGTEFSVWFSLVYDMLRAIMPNAKLGWPGLSPGPAIANRRQDSIQFYNQAIVAVNKADWIGIHDYYGGDGSTWQSMLARIITFANANPSRIILVTEWSNNGSVNKGVKGAEYVAFYNAFRSNTPVNVGAATCFVLKSSGDFQHECWLEKNGTRSPIVSALQASIPPTPTPIPPPMPITVIISVDSAYFRFSPEGAPVANIMGRLKRGTACLVLGKIGEWWRVELPCGAVPGYVQGYVHQSVVS